MICTNDDARAERCRIMSLHGISRDAWKRYTADGSWYYEIIAPGFKYNMTDVAAAMGLVQLRKSDRMHRRRVDIARKYSEAFTPMQEVCVPPAESNGDLHAWHLYALRLNLDRVTITRANFVGALKGMNIGASVHFIPLHLHPYYRDTYGYKPEDFPVAYREYQRVVTLPIYSRMNDQDVQDVIDAVSRIIERHRV
jgi:dTDP-4-amino-4,6-dideoxygalactose transaminase